VFAIKKVTIAYALLASCLAATELKPRTVQAFDTYIQELEARLAREVNSATFLWSDRSPQRKERAIQGEVVAESLTGKNPKPVPDGLIHDWIGAVFLPHATLEKTLELVKNYNHHKDVYKPEVIGSRLISRNGNDFKINLRLLKKKVITVVLDTYYDVHYQQLDNTRWQSRSYSTKIQELDNAGKPGERMLPPGDDHGFLWRLNSYWRFQERDGGVYVECEAVSLTRDIPTGLGWLIEPIVRQLPRESLINTLRKTREALSSTH
jgi:hypothetical protein